jgi:hypothetical protein
MGFPWSAWWESLNGNVWPLLVAVYLQALWYFYQLFRLLRGKYPHEQSKDPTGL